MDYNYEIILFKNKRKKKSVKKFITHKRALEYYNKLIEKSKNVLFEVQYENGFKSEFEIGILERNSKQDTLMIRDNYGRNLKVELDDDTFKIIKIDNYFIEEEFWDYTHKKKIDTHVFIKNYLMDDGLKLISKLNNKVIVQNDEKVNLFTFKTDDDSSRFMDTLYEHFKEIKKFDCMIVKDTSTAQRKYLYDILMKEGFTRTYLFRQITTHQVKK